MSVHDYNIPSVLKDNSGYFSGKKRAEEAVMRCFPQTGTVLRPGFIYGDRVVPELGITVPLGLVGEPVQKILALNPFQDITKVAEMLPGMRVPHAHPANKGVEAPSALPPNPVLALARVLQQMEDRTPLCSGSGHARGSWTTCEVTWWGGVMTGSDFALKTPVSVESVAACALSYAMDDVPSPGVVMVDSIA